MNTLYLDRKNLALSLEGGALVVRPAEGRITSFPLRLLGRVVTRTDVAMSSSVLAGLAAAGVGLVVLGGRFGDKVAVIPGGGLHNDASRRASQYRWLVNGDARRAMSRALVKAKLESQLGHLQEIEQARPGHRHAVRAGIDTVQDCLASLGESEELGLDVARGLEGAAAAAYFKVFAAILPGELGFDGRNRRPPRDPFNACLSLGYTLLHADAVQACYSVGLDPFIGFYHELAHGRESLATDLVEPSRARVDRLVLALFAGQSLRRSHFADLDGGCLLGKAGRRTFYGAYEELARPLRRLLRITAFRLARDLQALAPNQGGWVAP